MSNNGTANGDSRLKTAGLPPLAVRMWVGVGSAGRSRAIRYAVLGVLASDDANAATIGLAARAAMLAGDSNRDQLTLWSAELLAAEPDGR